MTIAIIGANGQVGSEISVLLEESGTDVRPVVRNEYGASFFDYHGMEYCIADFPDQSDAEKALHGVDAVVIAARDTSSPPRKARKINDRIIRNAVRYSGPETSIIYFSSIMAFGDRVHKFVPERSNWNRYRIDKLWLERLLRKEASDNDKDYYSLRLGHVFGRNQERKQMIKSKLENNDILRVACDPEQASNVVHTATLTKALLQCSVGQYPSGTYSLVNSPQWSWGKVFEYYNDMGTDIEYYPEKSRNTDSGRDILSPGLLFEAGKRMKLDLLFDYLPESVNDTVYNRSKLRNATAEISGYEAERLESVLLYMPIFGYDPIPGPFLEDLDNTEELIGKTGNAGKYFN